METDFCIVGSVNMDIITRAPRFPRPGETLRGISAGFMPGGKGANQAVALARLGGKVDLVGAIGDDLLGRQYGEILLGLGIGREGLAVLGGETTGTASITVADSGENEIVIVAGANGRVTPEYVRSIRDLIVGARFLLLQLEIPLESVLEAASIARAAGRTVILDPAPAVPLSDELLGLVDVITPNETEAAILTGADTSSEEGIRRAGEILAAKGIRTVIVKAGGRGAYLFEDGKFARVDPFRVKPVDTVAAGDTFNAGFAFALSRNPDSAKAVRFGNAVAAISTTKEGAQSAMPTLADLDAFLSSTGQSL